MNDGVYESLCSDEDLEWAERPCYKQDLRYSFLSFTTTLLTVIFSAGEDLVYTMVAGDENVLLTCLL